MYLVAAIVVVLLAVALSWWLERRGRRATMALQHEADQAMRSLRTVAHKRAKAASVPVPVNFGDSTPVMGIDIKTGEPVALESRRYAVGTAPKRAPSSTYHVRPKLRR